MNQKSQLREGLDRAWSTLQSGWRNLVNLASDALTRFLPSDDQDQDEESRALQAAGPGWGLLAAEMRESDDEILVRLEAPGMEPDQFDIEVEDDQLIISGEKRTEHEEQRGRYHLTERAYGRFVRVLPLPVPVEPDQAKAEYTQGVLKIRLPKHPAARARQIPVKTA